MKSATIASNRYTSFKSATIVWKALNKIIVLIALHTSEVVKSPSRIRGSFTKHGKFLFCNKEIELRFNQLFFFPSNLNRSSHDYRRQLKHHQKNCHKFEIIPLLMFESAVHRKRSNMRSIEGWKKKTMLNQCEECSALGHLSRYAIDEINPERYLWADTLRKMLSVFYQFRSWHTCKKRCIFAFVHKSMLIEWNICSTIRWTV